MIMKNEKVLKTQWNPPCSLAVAQQRCRFFPKCFKVEKKISAEKSSVGVEQRENECIAQLDPPKRSR